MKEVLSISSSLHVTDPQFSMPTKILSLLAIWKACYLSSQYFNSYWVDTKDDAPRGI